MRTRTYIGTLALLGWMYALGSSTIEAHDPPAAPTGVDARVGPVAATGSASTPRSDATPGG